MREVVHDMRNQLAIAIGTIEACIDGKLDPTHARLATVLKALNELDTLIGTLPAEREAS
jgi:hypothetical protein